MSSDKNIFTPAVGLYRKHQETLYNFIWRSIQILGKQGVTFIIFILSAKYLSPYDFGIYNYIFALIFMFAIFSDFGVSVTASRYTAQYLVADYNKLQILPVNSILIITVLSSVICIVVYFFRKEILHFEYFVYCIPMLFTVPLTSLYDGIYRGFKKFKELSIINFVFGVLFIPMIYFSINKWGVVGAIAAHNAYYLLLLLVVYFFSFTWKLTVKFRINKQLISDILKYSLLVGISDVGLFLYTRADVLILGHFNLVEEIGYYEIVNRIFLILIFPAQLLATVVAPKIAQVFTLGKSEIVKHNYARDVKLLFFAGLTVALLAFACTETVFRIVFANYDADILQKLMIVFLILIPFRFFSTYISIGYITPSGNVAISTVAILLFGVLNVLLDLILIKQFGLFGVIYATLISQILFIATRDLFFYFYVIRKLD